MGSMLDEDTLLAGQTGAVEESFLIRTLRDILNKHVLGKDVLSDKAIDDIGEDSLDALADLDTRMESLWDLCADPRTAEFLIRCCRAAMVLSEAAARGLALAAKLAAEGRESADVAAPTRASEVCLGCLANITTHKDVVLQMDESDVRGLAQLALDGLSSSEGTVVLQCLRLICALMMGPGYRSSSVLWQHSAIPRYIYVLENSLLVEVVQHAADALNQALVLDAAADGHATSSSGGPPRDCGEQLVALMASEGLGGILAQRIREVASGLAGEDPTLSGDGDPETALHSALCLGQSFLVELLELRQERASGGILQLEDLLALFTSAFRVLDSVGRPEVVDATLELLSSLLDWEAVERASKLNTGEGALVVPPAADATALRPQAAAFLAGTLGTGIVEKLIFFLQDKVRDAESLAEDKLRAFPDVEKEAKAKTAREGESQEENAQHAENDEEKEKTEDEQEDESSVEVALLLLDLAPWAKVREHSEALEPLLADLLSGRFGKALRQAASSVSPKFLRRLNLPIPTRIAASGMEEGHRARSRSRSRSRSR